MNPSSESESSTSFSPQAGLGTKTAFPSSRAITLNRLQEYVTLHNGTEPPFNNAYWNHYEPGLYVDLITGVPLFSSIDKYDSATGWPSFTRPINSDRVFTKEDQRLFSPRVEVRSVSSDTHLGHLFRDGPPPGKLRYCINSAALRFVPKDELEKQGYEEFRCLFS